jgi:hypothetical protein
VKQLARLLVLVGLVLGSAGTAFAQLPNLLADLRVERAKYPPTIDAAQAGELLNAVAWKHKAEGFGLLRKDSGNRCPQPSSGVSVSCDWLVNVNTGTGCDVLGSGPDSDPPANGPAIPQWCAGDAFDKTRFVTPVEAGGPPPPPPPPPPGTEAATADLQRAQLALLLQIATQQQQQLEAQRVQMEQLAAAIRDLKAEIAKGVRVRF